MLQYKSHRFYCEGVSFAIPDGYCLDTSYEEVPEDTLHLWSPDGSVYIRVGILRETRGPAEELNAILWDMGCTVDSAPTPILIGGLSGYCAIYSSDIKQYWEAHLAISGEGANQTELLLLIVAKGKLPSQDKLDELLQLTDPHILR